MDSYPKFASAENDVWQATGCPLPRDVFEEFRDVADPEARFHYMCDAAVTAHGRDLEDVIEDQINEFIEECESDHLYLDKLADLAANDEDRPVFRGRRRRVQVSGVPV